MTCFGMVRLSYEEIRQIIADHMAAKYGVPVDNVDLRPTKGKYGTKMHADINMVSGWPNREVDDA